MPLSTLDPIPALIIVDLQRGVLSLPTAHPVEQVVARSAALAAVFRSRALPVVLVNATGRAPGPTEAAVRAGSARPMPADWAEITDELQPQASDLRISKETWGAFRGTALHEELQRRRVTQVVVTGVATSAGVESTARAAHEHGYHVVLVTDAMTDLDPVLHEHSVGRVFPRIGETTRTAELLAAMDRTPLP